MCSSNQYAWPYSPTCAVPARIWTSISWLIYAYLIYQNSKTWYLHAPHVNIYLYYYFSYSIQVRDASFLFSALLIKQGPLNIWTEHSNCQIHSRGDSKTLIALLIPIIFLILLIKVCFYAYKSWGHDPIWYFSCLCRKFSELRVLLFLSSTQTSQNLKFIQKCPCLSSLKNKFQWTQNSFWPLIRKILMWNFKYHKSS